MNHKPEIPAEVGDHLLATFDAVKHALDELGIHDASLDLLHDPLSLYEWAVLTANGMGLDVRVVVTVPAQVRKRHVPREVQHAEAVREYIASVHQRVERREG